jgi:hypothetical protein
MLLRHEDHFFIWQHFLRDCAETVIVLPSPHGDYKSGISYSDGRAVGEVYRKLQTREDLHLQSSETLVDGLCTNLILVAGKKANRLADDIQSAINGSINFYLDDGVIYDKDKQGAIMPKFLKGAARSIENITADYGLIRFIKNPFEPSRRVLQIGGIKGHGTLAAAMALTKDRHVQKIQQLLKKQVPDEEIANLVDKTLEILVKICVANGRIRRDSLTIEKIIVNDHASVWKWESEEYRRTEKIIPHGLYFELIEKANSGTSVLKLRIDDHPIKFTNPAG